MTLTFSELPSGLGPGWYYLTVFVAGVPSESVLVKMECSIAITEDPSNETVAAGEAALFSVATQGGRRYQWQQCVGDAAACPRPPCRLWHHGRRLCRYR